MSQQPTHSSPAGGLAAAAAAIDALAKAEAAGVWGVPSFKVSASDTREEIPAAQTAGPAASGAQQGQAGGERSA